MHRLDQIDERLAELSAERRSIVDALSELREELYPPVPWAHGRRPPDVDRSPLPPAPAGAQTIGGRDLRVTCLTILRRHGATSLPELHGLLHRYGYLVGARRPVTALSDAMAYEVERGRARRVARGIYASAGRPPRCRRAGPPVADQPAGPWFDHRSSPLDPDLDEDPGTWNGSDERAPPHEATT